MYQLCHAHLTNLTKIERAQKKYQQDIIQRKSRVKLKKEEQKAKDLKQRRKEWIEIVTSIGLDRVKQLEQNPESLKVEDLKLLMNLKSNKIEGLEKLRTQAQIADDAEELDQQDEKEVVQLDDE